MQSLEAQKPLKLHRDAHAWDPVVRPLEIGLGVGALFIAGQAAIHGMELPITWLASLPHNDMVNSVVHGFFNGFHAGLNYPVDALVDAAHKIPQVGQYVDMSAHGIMQLPHVSETLHTITNQSNTANEHIVATMEAVAAPVGLLEIVKYGGRKTREHKIEKIKANLSQTTLEEQASAHIVSELQSRWLSRKYNNLSASAIENRIQEVQEDLKKAKTSEVIGVGTAAGEAVNWISRGGIGSIQKGLANVTLKNETYERLTGSPLHWALSKAFDNKIAKALFLVPVGGDDIDTSYSIFKFVMPKKDIFGRTRRNGGLVMNGARFALGLIPFVTSDNADAFVETLSRGALNDPSMATRLTETAAVVVGDEVRRNPSKFK